MSPRIKRFKDAGLLGCFNDTGVTSANYKEILMDEWIDIWKSEPPRYQDILFMTGDHGVHVGCLQGDEKLRKCKFLDFYNRVSYECDAWVDEDHRVIFWFPLPKLPGEKYE